MFTQCSFDAAENNMPDCYRGKKCMKIFCLDLKKHAEKIINYETKEMIPLTKKEKKMHDKQKVCYICKKKFSTDDTNKKFQKVRDHCYYTGRYRGAAHDIFNLRYKIPKEIPVVFHNGSIYGYHFINKELAEESEGPFECLGENMEKYITFSAPIKKELDHGKSVTYIKFVDSFRLLPCSLSTLVDNLSDINSEKLYFVCNTFFVNGIISFIS